MTKARDLANLISTGNPLSDGAVSVAEVTGAAPLASPTFTGDVTLPDKIVHTGDTDTAIRFNATDEVSVETGGARRALFNNNGLGVTGAISATQNVTVQSASGQEGVQLLYNENGGEISLYGTSGNTKTLIDFLDGNDDGNGLTRMLNLGSGTDGMQLGVANAANTGGISLTTGNNTQRFFVGSSGQLGIGASPTYGTSGQVLTSGGSGAAPTWADASSGGSADFVASGTIANGAVVVLNANGTVSTPTTVTEGLGSEATFASSGSSPAEHMSSTFDSANNKVIVGYRDQNNNGYATAVVGTVSGDTISFGTPVVVNSGNSYYVAVVFAGGSHNKVVVAFRDVVNSNYGRCAVGQVSGTTITFGSTTTFETANSNHIAGIFDSANSKVIFAYTDSGNSQRGTARVGSISGTNNSISFASAAVVFDTGETGHHSLTFDTNTNKVLFVYKDTTETSLASVVGSVSGTTITFGNQTIISTDDGQFIDSTIDTTNNKLIVVYRRNSDGHGQAFVGSVSGTTLTFGSANTFSTAQTFMPSVAYNSSANKISIIYRDQTNSNKIKTVVGTISGTNITYSSAVTVGDYTSEDTFARYDSNSNKTVLGWTSTSNGGRAGIYNFPSTNAGNYVGIAAAAISDTATGSITINGGINESQSSLAVGTTYYVADNGTLQTTNNGRKIGKAISATKLLVNSNMSGDEMNAYLGGLV